MKMLLVVFNVSIEAEVKALLSRGGAPCFTQWPRLVGRGEATGARFDDSVWPGANSALFTIVEDGRARELLAQMEELRRGEARREGLRAYILNVEAATDAPLE